MAYATGQPAARQLSGTTWHVISTILAVVGIVVAALGAWMEFGPDNGVLTLFGWTWNVADLSTLWAPFLMMAGGALTALSMGVESARDWEAESSRWLVILEGLVTLAGIVAFVIGVVLLF